MILGFENIVKLIKEPKNGTKIKEARKNYNLMNMLVNGENVAGFLSQISNFENDDQFTLRKDHAKSTKHIYSNVLAPVSKVFSAKGSVIDYDLKDKEGFISYLSKIRDNVSLRKWLENNWMNRLHYDANGLIYVELDESGEKPYPTYKSIASIYDYKRSGQYIEYVIFEPEEIKGDESVKIYRVIDDEKD